MKSEHGDVINVASGPAATDVFRTPIPYTLRLGATSWIFRDFSPYYYPFPLDVSILTATFSDRTSRISVTSCDVNVSLYARM